MNGENVYVFEFPSVQDADGAVSLVRPDGSAIGSTAITWVDTPHFYRDGALIALYVGRTAGLRHAFETVLGPPFAGGAR